MNALQWDIYEDTCQCPDMTGFNMTVCVDVPKGKCSPERMLKACQEVLDKQRYFHIHLLMSADGEPQVCEDWDMPNSVHYREMGDAEWDEGKESLIKAFDLFNEPCGRLHVVATPTRTIVIVELHHMFFDGLSIKAAFNNIEDALHGRPVFQQGDLAAEFNEAEVATYGSEEYEQSKALYLEKVGGQHFADFCRKTDNPFGKSICVRLHFSQEIIDNGCRRLGTSFALLFNAAYALALGQMTGEEKLIFYATNHGRKDKRLTDRVYGNYLKNLPILRDINPAQTVAELLAQTKTAIFQSIRHRIYPSFHLLRDLDIDFTDYGTEMSPQGPFIYEYLNVDGESYVSYHIEASLTYEHAITVIIIREDSYEVAVDGSDALYTEEQLKTFARLIGEYALKLASTDTAATVGDIMNSFER